MNRLTKQSFIHPLSAPHLQRSFLLISTITLDSLVHILVLSVKDPSCPFLQIQCQQLEEQPPQWPAQIIAVLTTVRVPSSSWAHSQAPLNPGVAVGLVLVNGGINRFLASKIFALLLSFLGRCRGFDEASIRIIYQVQPESLSLAWSRAG